MSAVVGVTCALWMGTLAVFAAAAVALVLVAMHLTNSIHPPCGVTALIAAMAQHCCGSARCLTCWLIR
ncbi:MAG: hypothetical protein HOI95_04605 [Chromatiales bacterium]|nr:hypothetical protein [Chromatiales bacterium]